MVHQAGLEPAANTASLAALETSYSGRGLLCH